MPERRSKPIVVLLVEDSPSYALMIRELLGDVFDVLHVGSLTSALDILASEVVDVVLLDLCLPDSQGMPTLQHVLDASPDRPIVVLTGLDDETLGNEAIRLGAQDYIVKDTVVGPAVSRAIHYAIHRKQALNALSRRIAPVAASEYDGAVLNRLPLSVIIVNADAQIIFTNKKGADMLSCGGSMTRDGNGGCKAVIPRETKTLHRVIRCVAKGAPGFEGGTMLSLHQQNSPLLLPVLITNLDRRTEARGRTDAAVLLMAKEPDSSGLPSVSTLAQMLDVSNSEARLALALVEGKRIEEAAEEQGITVSSARTFSKRLFSRTGTGRQAELVRLILTMLPPIPDDIFCG